MTQEHEMSNLEKVKLLARTKIYFEKTRKEFNGIFYHGGYAERKAFIKIIEELLVEYQSGILNISIEKMKSLRLHLDLFKEEIQSQQIKLDHLRKVRTGAYKNFLDHYKLYFQVIGQLNIQELDELISEFGIEINRDSYPFEYHQWTEEAIRIVDQHLKSGKTYKEIANIINQYDGEMKVRCVESFLEAGSLEFVEQYVEPYYLEEIEKEMILKHKTPYERYRCV